MAVTLDIIDEMFDIDLHDGLLSETVEWDGVSIHHPQIHDPGIQYERLCLSTWHEACQYAVRREVQQSWGDHCNVTGCNGR